MHHSPVVESTSLHQPLGKLEKTEGVGSLLYTWIQFTLNDGMSIEVRVKDVVVCLTDEVSSLVM